jgi:acyl carrier protein
MALADQIKELLNNVLQLNGRARGWSETTPLLGSLPELDSMAVASIITAIEEEFGITIADDEIDADVFASLGSLTHFVEQKLPT